MWSGWWLWPLVAVCTADFFRDEAERIMRDSPVIDGHNDLPWQLLDMFNNRLQDERANLTTLAGTHTNIPKLRAGFVGGQFWSVYTPCDTQNKDAVRRTLEQMDVVHRMCRMYPETFLYVTSSAGIRQAFREGKVASLIGVEGGHSIDSSLGVLRALYQLGMRYLTLTHSCNTPWADNWLVDTGDSEPQSQGLSPFGQRVVKELNRLGVLIDLAHVSVATMKATLQLSRAPVIFSHSSAYSVCASRRNVPDDVLRLVKQTDSLVMVNFYNNYISCTNKANLSQVADHLDHIKEVAGARAVGFGGDFDGVPRVPEGLEDVSKYPDLIAELLRRNWTEAEVKGALADNLLRVFEAVEQASNLTQAPEEEPIPLDQLGGSCRTHYGYSSGASSLHRHWGLLLASLAPLVLCLSLL
ncbi:dipeptidase 1 isoform X1 [Homo sapiens]|uniref:Dipeptidase 1 n=6 Tax=Homo sapiens TaxID=9606 RepID=DPEP1_HUMAN|eukprot:NP_001121613.1 dipeptidase 1 precursor [Homo sapiens]